MDFGALWFLCLCDGSSQSAVDAELMKNWALELCVPCGCDGVSQRRVDFGALHFVLSCNEVSQSLDPELLKSELGSLVCPVLV